MTGTRPTRCVRTRGERGVGSLLVALVVLFVFALSLAATWFGVARAAAVRLQGAADLAALAGAEAQRLHRQACEAVRASAAANTGRVTRCEVTGDEVEFVVSVELTVEVRFGPVQLSNLSAQAHTGVITGAPDPTGG